MSADNLITFIIEEAQHRVINDEYMKNAESALAARTKKSGNSKGKKKVKGKLDITCKNCKKTGHGKPDCYAKGGGKEGQGPKQKRAAKGKEPDTAVVTTDNDERELFMFTCTSDYSAIMNKLDVPKSRLGTCIDSGASRDYCPDRSKFITYKAVNRKITTADGRTLRVIGMGDLEIKLRNGSGKTKTVFKDAIHTPDMVFTLISISRLDNAGFSVNFNKGMCTIKNPKG
jgi:hypothetical protein